MKKFFSSVLILLALVASFTSCEREGANFYDVYIMVYYPDGYDVYPAADQTVTIRNTLTGQETTVTTGEYGSAKASLEDGIYTITASTETEEFYFNGINENLTISEKRNYWRLNLEASAKGGGLILKEIYHSGSRTSAGGSYYSDQFHEIYNNSDVVQYLDGLCLGVLEPIGTAASVWINTDGTLMDRLPVAFHALMFPGTGQQYPIQPRTSVVVAQDGINHQSDPNGNPLSPVNLGNAQFEVFVEAPGKDTDSPGAINMTIMYTTSATAFDWLASVNGAATIIFRLPTGLDYTSFVANPENFMTKPGTTSTTKYFMVHKNWVVDGVDLNRGNEADRYKRLPTSVDAGMTWCSTSYNSKSVRRKVERILDGKVIYMDTNNSYNDFVGDWIPTPFLHPTEVD